MLILTRKLGESITIGDDIKISVLGVHGRQVRLGIEAPASVVVHREEVYVRIQNENRKASKSAKKDLMGMVSMLRDKLKGKNLGKAGSTEIDMKESSKSNREQRRRGGDRKG